MRVDSTGPYFLKNLTISFGFTSTGTFPTKIVRASFSFFVPELFAFCLYETSLPVLALSSSSPTQLEGFHLSTFTILGAYFFALSSVSDDDKSPGTYSL